MIVSLSSVIAIRASVSPATEQLVTALVKSMPVIMLEPTKTDATDPQAWLDHCTADGAAMTGNRIMIYRPKDDGTYGVKLQACAAIVRRYQSPPTLALSPAVATPAT